MTFSDNPAKNSGETTANSEVSASIQTWVWLRGLAREHGHWGRFLDDFKKAFPGKTVITLDLPGMGNMAHIPSPLSIGEMLPTLRKEVKQQVGDEKVGLFAISLGGMVAMEWMHQAPEDLAKVVLINSSSRRQSPFYDRLRLAALGPLVRVLLTQSPRQRELRLLKLISNKPEKHREIASEWAAIAKERPPTLQTFVRQLTAAARYEPPSQFSAAVPVTVLVSLGDRFVEPQCSLNLAKAYNWPVRTHSWGGHDLPVDDPEWLIEAMRQIGPY